MERLEYIDDYFKGELLPEQAREFEKRIAEEPQFAEEVVFYINTYQVAKAQLVEDKKRRFLKIYQEADTSVSARPLKRIWQYAAAAVIVVMLVGGYLFIQPTRAEKLADNYIQKNLQTLRVTMGSATSDLQTGLGLYNKTKLQAALKQFEAVIHSDTANYNAKKYAGIVYLRLEQFDKALLYFKQLEKYPGLFANPGKFYQALTLMKRNHPGDIQRSKQLLHEVIKYDLEGKESAQDLLEQL